jgi:hypothetical protein
MSADYRIVKTKALNGLALHSLLSEPIMPATTIDIHIHGAAGNFYG